MIDAVANAECIRVVTGATVQRIIAGAADDKIVPRTTIKNIVSACAGQVLSLRRGHVKIKGIERAQPSRVGGRYLDRVETHIRIAGRSAEYTGTCIEAEPAG